MAIPLAFGGRTPCIRSIAKAAYFAAARRQTFARRDAPRPQTSAPMCTPHPYSHHLPHASTNSTFPPWQLRPVTVSSASMRKTSLHGASPGLPACIAPNETSNLRWKPATDRIICYRLYRLLVFITSPSSRPCRRDGECCHSLRCIGNGTCVRQCNAVLSYWHPIAGSVCPQRDCTLLLILLVRTVALDGHRSPGNHKR